MEGYEKRINEIKEKVNKFESQKLKEREGKDKHKEEQQRKKALIRQKFLNIILGELETAIKENEKVDRLIIIQFKKLKDSEICDMLFYREEDYKLMFKLSKYYKTLNSDSEHNEKIEFYPETFGVESLKQLIQSFNVEDEEIEQVEFSKYLALGGFLEIECSKNEIVVIPKYTEK